MSKTPILIVLTVVLIAGLGGWWYVNKTSNDQQNSAVQPPAPLVSTVDVQAAAEPTVGTPNTITIPETGSSDQSLSQEAAGVDAQINGLSSDNAAADKGMSSQ